MAKNIEINYNSGSGYEVLYPKTIPELTGCLPLTGGTLTGPLTLNGEPSGEMEAVNKGYVDGIGVGVEGLKQVLLWTVTATSTQISKGTSWTSGTTLTQSPRDYPPYGLLIETIYNNITITFDDVNFNNTASITFYMGDSGGRPPLENQSDGVFVPSLVSANVEHYSGTLSVFSFACRMDYSEDGGSSRPESTFLFSNNTYVNISFGFKDYIGTNQMRYPIIYYRVDKLNTVYSDTSITTNFYLAYDH